MSGFWNVPEKENDLGYLHIIIDEGQDFGMIDAENEEDKENVEEMCSIIDALQEATLANNGTFQLFYDKYQMIQSSHKM